MEGLDVLGVLKALQRLERNVSVALMYSGLRIPQFRLLSRLDEMGQATVTEMSRTLAITRATASVMINALIKSHIVAVVENPSDRRSFHIKLTELGRNKLHVARSDVAVLQSKLHQRYSPELIRQLNAFAAASREHAGGAVDL